jgi:hypothetical protein
LGDGLDETHGEAQSLAQVHDWLFKKVMRNCAAAQVHDSKTVRICSYDVGTDLRYFWGDGVWPETPHHVDRTISHYGAPRQFLKAVPDCREAETSTSE